MNAYNIVIKDSTGAQQYCQETGLPETPADFAKDWGVLVDGVDPQIGSEQATLESLLWMQRIYEGQRVFTERRIEEMRVKSWFRALGMIV